MINLIEFTKPPMSPLKFVLAFFIAFPVVLSCRAQIVPTSVTVSGDVAKPLVVSVGDFKTMKFYTVNRPAHDGVTHTYQGISLYDLLVKAGAVPGGQLKGTALSKYVVVAAKDKYQVVIALPEFDPTFCDQMIILANEEDAKPLPADLGTYQLIVPADKKPARCVWGVTSIIVRTAKAE